MRLALNGATIMHAPLEIDVEVASAAGFSALEIWAGKLAAYERDRPLAALREHMAACGITPWCINSVEDITYRDRAGRAEVMAQLGRALAAARTLGAPSVVVVPGRRPDGFNRHESVRDAVEVLRAMSDIAGDVGLAFEFLGKPGCSVPVLDMAIDIVSEVERANVGMVIDTFHFHAGGSRLEALQRVPVQRLFVVHLNGCEGLPREQLTDAHRLYPGEGPIPVRAILSDLRARGYDGMASVEIFRPEYWEQDPVDVARTAYDRAAGVLKDAGYEIHV
ncbi:MAG: sugar phosphate isomerase/epimerase [Chloroflexi bacterium]|nr:sugar phosphate isomerase/epimerase [Chloroflexota bacterium]